MSLLFFRATNHARTINPVARKLVRFLSSSTITKENDGVAGAHVNNHNNGSIASHTHSDTLSAISLKGTADVALGTKGVFRDNEEDDIKVLVSNFTAPALAEGLRAREGALQRAAALVYSGHSGNNHNMKELKELLFGFLKENVEKRRIRKHRLDLEEGFTRAQLVILQRYLHKMPRHVFHAAGKRASVVIPLCNVNGVASILFQRRSESMRTHRNQVCFPGGMLEEGVDATIVQTSLRETEEELGIPRENIEVLGILRCNWNEVASMAGVAVTPVVGFIGELNELQLEPNQDEVGELFTIPLSELVQEHHWHTHTFSSPVFTGHEHKIWGLTAYLLRRFIRDVVVKCSTNSNRNSGDGFATTGTIGPSPLDLPH